ncbi:MAG: N-acetylmuramoyl-L-alanine amidase [Deferribacteres bacterium]|nr:N-acetylmuramoyl-L-alanine amidase [candidate division KSB1 bacterium]MCB9512030.1 N-acetylmuramoyl-L-alanine amidase [Deferribacteres bacterium]
MSKKIVLIIPLFFVVSCASKMKIIDTPISFSENRIEQTREYIREHYGLEVDDITMVPKIVVLHWTAIDDFDATFAVFNREMLGGSRPDLQGAGQVNVGIQFAVDRDGTVHRLMPENWVARHCIGLNYDAIGVENVGGANGVDNMTDEQIAANIKLVRYLKKKYPSIEYLIGHHEYQEFDGHPLWRELDDSYRTEKTDPGERFMNAVRAGVADLNLKGVDEIRAEK